jgi:spermidine/putrescine transport system permease protein
LGEKGGPQPAVDGARLISEPSRLFVYNDIGTFIVLTYVYLPFAILSCTPRSSGSTTPSSPPRRTSARAHRGRSATSCYPQIRPGLITAAIFVFIPILGEFLTPSMVGGASGC